MKYELLTIFPNALSDEEVSLEHKKIINLIISSGGSVAKDEIVGRKRFSYPVKTERTGAYTYAQFELEPSATPALEQAIRLNIKTRRFSITKYTDSSQRTTSSLPRTSSSKLEPTSIKSQELKPEDIEKLDTKIEELLNEEIK